MKAAIVGAGRMGAVHAQACVDLGVEVALVTDLRPDRAAALAARFGARSVEPADWVAELAQRRPELVVVAATVPAHAEAVATAAALGARFVFCEKPMGGSLVECDAMIDACARAGARLAINHPAIHMPIYRVPAEIAETGEVGEIRTMSVVAGNMGMAMNGSHFLAAFEFVCSEVSARVSARFSSTIMPNPRGREFEDRAGFVVVEGRTGKRLTLSAEAEQGHGLSVVYCGRHGQIYVDELEGNVLVQARLAEHRQAPSTRYTMPWSTRRSTITSTSVFEPTRDTLRDLIGGGPIFADGERARRIVAVLVAAYESDARGGAYVDVDGDLPRDRSFPWA
jgi:predicted dehydrogenase